jgi:Ni/Co efflux regulator RcnB
MIKIINAEAISRRKALTLLGLATAAFAASSVVAAPDADAQTAGMERRQARRAGRQERRQERRTGRTERRQERRQ